MKFDLSQKLHFVHKIKLMTRYKFYLKQYFGIESSKQIKISNFQIPLANRATRIRSLQQSSD